MKYLLLSIWISLVISCNPKEEKPPVTETPVSKDSIAVRPDDNNSYILPDLSPLDMIYFPIDYPKLKMTKAITSDPYVRIIYSRPRKQGRVIFGELLKYGVPWRLGANEATEIQLFRTAMIQGKKVEPGRYILYCIPEEKNWTIILNSNIDSWGLQQDPSKDITRFTIPVTRNDFTIEYFTMFFEKTDKGASLVMAWDDVTAKLPFTW